MLSEFIALNREELIRRCRGKVAARTAPLPTEAELDLGIPLFIDQLADALLQVWERLGLPLQAKSRAAE